MVGFYEPKKWTAYLTPVDNWDRCSVPAGGSGFQLWIQGIQTIMLKTQSLRLKIQYLPGAPVSSEKKLSPS